MGDIDENSTEFNIFQYFLDVNFVSQIVQFTNQFHQFFIRNVDISMHSRLQCWRDVTVQELYIFLAITMLMTRNRHLSIEEHWSTDILLFAPIFGNLMSRNRFTTILGMLHFSTSNMNINDSSISKLFKIENVINHARNKYRTIMTPYKNMCIDESIVPFKGRLSFKQYLPKKRNRFGIKLFVLCDVSTGIIIDFIVYCGVTSAITHIQNLGISGSVVVTLIRDYFKSNRHLYIDNWYTSPKLLQYLYDNQIYACGTVRKNRVGMPTLNRKLAKGEIQSQFSAPLTALKWKDKKEIHMLTSIHSDDMGPSMTEDRATGLPVMKPSCVLDYSKNMGSVDTSDMLLSSVQCIRKSVKWYKKLFFHIIDLHMLNAFFCFKQIKNTPSLHFAKFQLELIRQIIQNYKSTEIMDRSISIQNINNPLRILSSDAAKHMPMLNTKHQRCKECSKQKKRKETRYFCTICRVFLCAAPCFQLYHQ